MGIGVWGMGMGYGYRGMGYGYRGMGYGYRGMGHGYRGMGHGYRGMGMGYGYGGMESWKMLGSVCSFLVILLKFLIVGAHINHFPLNTFIKPKLIN